MVMIFVTLVNTRTHRHTRELQW